ncbi:MAG TPA: hypothetical protein VME46_06645 [Acidimicrobiales bacterium]|nr:hypothetical protein [Acidimicrobiales bacterium]
MPPANALAEHALALAEAAGQSSTAIAEAAAELANSSERTELDEARIELANRIHHKSDDHRATAALSLVNRALAAKGWRDPYDWRRRRKP